MALSVDSERMRWDTSWRSRGDLADRVDALCNIISSVRPSRERWAATHDMMSKDSNSIISRHSPVGENLSVDPTDPSGKGSPPAVLDDPSKAITREGRDAKGVPHLVNARSSVLS